MRFRLLYPLLSLSLLYVVFAGCSSGHPKSEDDASSQVATGQNASRALTSISVEEMRDLWANCDALDIIFYHNSFSISQNDRPAIQNSLGYFLPTEATHNPGCKPIGRMTFLVQGEIRQEADIYLSKDCNYVIWIKDNKNAHINPLSPQGIAFFQGIIQKGQEHLNK
jgi:hypothetical protein